MYVRKTVTAGERSPLEETCSHYTDDDSDDMLLVASPVKGLLPFGPHNVPWVLVLYSLVTITQNVLGENSTTTTVHVAANFLVGT